MASEGLNIPITGDASGLVAAFQSASTAINSFKNYAVSAYDAVNLKAQKAASLLDKGIVDTKTLKAFDEYRVAWSRVQMAGDAYYSEIASRSKQFRDSLKAEVAEIARAKYDEVSRGRSARGQDLVDFNSYVEKLKAKSQELKTVLSTNAVVEQENVQRARSARAALTLSFDSYVDEIKAKSQELRATFAANTEADRRASDARRQSRASTVFNNLADEGIGFSDVIKKARDYKQALNSVTEAQTQRIKVQKESVSVDKQSSNAIADLIAKYAKLGAAGFGLHKMWSAGAQLFSKLIKNYNDLGHAILGLKLVTGDTTEQTSEFLYVANMMGVSSLSLQMRIAQMAKHLVDNHKWVKALGVEYKNLDGTVKPTSQTFFDFADAISAITDSEKREASAMAVFGRGYKDILPVLALTKKQREDMIKQGREGGSVWSDKELRQQLEFERNQRALTASLQQLGATLMRAVAPHLMGFFNLLRDLANKLREMAKSSPAVANAIKAIGLALLTMWNPLVGVTTLLAILVQRFEPVGEIIIAVANILGEVVGKVIGTIARTMQIAADIVLTAVDSILAGLGLLAKGLSWITFGAVNVTGTIDAWRSGIQTAKSAIDGTVGEFADWMWDNGGKVGKQFGEGFVAILKKLKIKPSDINLGFGEGSGFDPSTSGGGGKSAKSKKSKLLEYFTELVNQSRDVLNTLRDNAVKAYEEMRDLSKKTADDISNALSLSSISDTLGGYARPGRMIRMFEKRLADLRNYLANIKTLRSLGVPAEMLQDIVSMGLTDGARMAKMLVANPSAIPKMVDLQAQIRAASTDFGLVIGEAVYGQKATDALAAAIGAQGQFQSLLGQGGKFGYKSTQADIEAATTNITQQVQMNVQSNADPAVIEQAIAWALKTGIPLVVGGGTGGSRSSNVRSQVPGVNMGAPTWPNMGGASSGVWNGFADWFAGRGPGPDTTNTSLFTGLQGPTGTTGSGNMTGAPGPTGGSYA